MKIIAIYKCLKCGHNYTGKPGPTICPICNHVYIKWVNYDDIKKKLGN